MKHLVWPAGLLGGALLLLMNGAACGGGDSNGNGSSSDGGTGGGPDDAPSTGTMSVFTQGTGKKVQPTQAPGMTNSVSVETYRDATIGAQVAVHSSGGDLHGVQVTIDDLSDGAGHTIAKTELTLYREIFIDFTGVMAHGGNVPVPAQSPTMDGRIPDPLVPLVDPYSGANAGQPFLVGKDLNGPLFLDIHVPKGTTAGTYTGKLHITANSDRNADVPISVKVYDLDAPDMRSVTTHFKMSENDLIQYHGGISACSGGSCYIDGKEKSHTILKRYEELVHAHRIDVQQTFQSPPVDGCKLPTDWSAYDSVMGPYMDGSYWSDKVPSSFYDVPFAPGSTYGLETCSQAEYTALAKAWADHLKSKGWFDRAIAYATDEPASSMYPDIAKYSMWMQAGDPDWLAHIMDTTQPDPSDVATLNPALGIYCVALGWYDNWNAHGPFYGRKDWPTLMSQGKKLWLYESNAQDPPYVTFATNTLDGLEPTMMMWGAWYEHASGFLYYDLANWDQKQPWGPTIEFNKTGDGVLIYPGNHDGLGMPLGSPADVAIDGPVPSYRLKMVRQGLQDWALFALADTKGVGDMLRTEVAKVYSQLGGCTYSGCPQPAGGFFWKTDEAMMAQIRATAIQLILSK
jgi:hypothetical protein